MPIPDHWSGEVKPLIEGVVNKEAANSIEEALVSSVVITMNKLFPSSWVPTFARGSDESRRRNYFRADHLVSCLLAGMDLPVDAGKRDNYLNSTIWSDVVCVENVRSKVREFMERGQENASLTVLAAVMDEDIVTKPLIKHTTPRERWMIAFANERKTLPGFGRRDKERRLRGWSFQLREKLGETGAVVRFQQVDDIFSHWKNAPIKIKEGLEADKLALPNMFTKYFEGTRWAFEDFSQGMAETTAIQQAQLDMVASAFDAMAGLPPPFGFIGTAGGVAFRQLHASEYDAKPAVVVRKSPDNDDGMVNSVTKSMNEWSETYATATTVGANMKGLAVFRAFQNDLSKLFDDYQRKLIDAVNEWVRGVFGDNDDGMREKLADYLELGSTRSGIGANGGDSLHQAKKMIDDFRDGCLKTIKHEFFAENIKVSPEDFRSLVLLDLLSAYVVAQYQETGGIIKNKWAKMIIEDPILNHLAVDGVWGVVIKDSQHKSAKAAKRLSWKGGGDHKQALYIFCSWYQKNCNAFKLLESVQVLPSGINWTTKEIVKRKDDYLGQLANAIDNNRKKGTFYGKNWQWDDINAAVGKITVP